MENDTPGTREFEDFLDKDIVVQMYDGQLIYGILRSFDQFNNITLERTVTRIFYENKYAERMLGLYMIRGENIVFLGCTKLDIKNLQKHEWDVVESKLEEQKIDS